MIDTTTAARLSADRVSITNGHGPLPGGALLKLVVDAGGITLHGGEPVTAWQIPFAAISMMTVSTRRDGVEVSGWVSGEYLALRFPLEALVGGTPHDLDALVAAGTGRDIQNPGVASPRSMRRWLLAALGIAVVVIIGVVVAVVLSSTSTAPAKATAQDRSLAGSKNLVHADVPSGWGTDDPLTAPLSGLLGTAQTSTPTATDKKAYKTVISGFEACMGESNATDRVFGSAGVTPLVQVPGAPFGQVTSTSYIEAGSVTQRYSSATSVAADLVQIKSPRFPTCFAQVIGRIVMIGADPAKASATVFVTPEKLPSPLGVSVTGSNVFVEIPTGSSTVVAEVGITLIVSGPYEQTLYTFSMPGAFPADLRSQMVSLLSGRLVGSSEATPA